MSASAGPGRARRRLATALHMIGTRDSVEVQPKLQERSAAAAVASSEPGHATLDGVDEIRPQVAGRDDAVERADLERPLHGVDPVVLVAHLAELLQYATLPSRAR